MRGASASVALRIKGRSLSPHGRRGLLSIDYFLKTDMAKKFVITLPLLVFLLFSLFKGFQAAEGKVED